MTRGRKILRGIGIVVLVAAILLAILLIYITVNEYRPADIETVSDGSGTIEAADGMTLRVASINTGYAALSAGADFFMDGGKSVQGESRELIIDNMNGIINMMQACDADAFLLQEVDIDSDRSYNIDEAEVYELQMGMPGVFAYNYNCAFVPYPIPMIGHVEAGLLTMTNLHSTQSQRYQLPLSFSWPVSTCNLKRCLLVEHIPLQGSDKELVLVNLHLEAYDSGEGKIAQTKMLCDILEAEYKKGNYVIAGGDFNQTFEGVAAFPVVDEESFVPGLITQDDLPEGFSIAADDSVPTTRILSAPYSGSYETTQVFIIDGFLVSDNVTINEVQTLDYGFAYTDHQPVVLTARLAAA